MLKLLITILGIVLSLPVLSQQDAVRLGCDDDWYPYAAAKDGKAEGLSVDIVLAAYKAVNVPVKLSAVPFNRGMILTQKEIYDGVFNGTLEESMQASYQVPRNPITRSEQVVLGPTGSPAFKGLEDFRDRRLGTTLGYTYPDKILKDPRVKVEVSTKDLNNLMRLAVRRIDFTIIDRMVGMHLISTHKAELAGKIEEKGSIDPVDLSILFNRSARASKFLADFDRGMDLIKKDGTYERIINNWIRKFQ